MVNRRGAPVKSCFAGPASPAFNRAGRGRRGLAEIECFCFAVSSAKQKGLMPLGWGVSVPPWCCATIEQCPSVLRAEVVYRLPRLGGKR